MASPAPAGLAERGDRPLRTTTQAIAETAARLGARDLFTLMGGTNMRIVHDFADAGIALHHFRHENGAVGAADGFARATGEVGWSSTIHGPGLTNAITALRTAVRARSPQVLVMADTTGIPPRAMPFEAGVQGLAPEPLLAAIDVPIVRVSAATAARDTIAAHRLAGDARTPVVLILPHGIETDSNPVDVDRELAEAEGASPGGAEDRRAVVAATDQGGVLASADDAPAEQAGPSSLVPEENALDAAAEAIRTARQTVIVAGRGANDPGTVAGLKRLAEQTGAYLATSVQAVGLFDDSPANLGIFGGFSHRAARRVIMNADCVLAVGAGLNHLQTRQSRYLAGTTLVQVDVDERAFGRHDRADIVVHGDAALAARGLVERFEARPVSPPRELPVAPVRQQEPDVSRPGALDPRAVTAAIERALPVERTVVIDGGHFTVWPICFMRHPGPDAMMWTCDFGAVGCGLGPALGAAVGRPDRLTALFIGDCGFYMTMGELEVAVRERIPLLVVCYNDGAAGSELLIADQAGLAPEHAIFGMADLAKAAAGLGVAGSVARELGDIDTALAGWDRQGPFVLDCHLTRDVRSPARTAED